MPPPTPPRPLIRFDFFEADLQSAELRKRGRRLRLQEQPFRVLAMLLERPGEVVTREDMRQKLWPADTFVDFDHGLNSAVARLREALDDSAEDPRFVETVPRQGYRFIGDLDLPVPAGTPKEALTKDANTNSWMVPAAATLGILLSVGVWWPVRNGRSDPPSPLVELTPLAGTHGYEFDPAFSPDGTQVAFLQIDGPSSGIYAALVGGEKPLRLTKAPNDCCPAWSPDRRQVAFLRRFEDQAELYVVPALGGTERRLYTLPRPAFPGLTWSPDGKFLAFPEGHPSSAQSRITLLSLSDATRRQLTFPPEGSRDEEPAFSPDASQLAFVRGTIAGVVNDVFVVPTSGGEAKRLTFDNCPNFGVAWTSDGRNIVFSSRRGGEASLWRVSASGGTPQPVAGPGSPAEHPSLALKGDLLAYEQMIGKEDILRIDLTDRERSRTPPVVVVSEKGSKLRPRFSPDGSRIAFESNRLGNAEIWICNRAGGNCAQLTSLRGTAGTSAWSPDGGYLAFEYHPKERAEIYVVELPSGEPQLVPTVPGADNLAPSWSRDGKWIYFASKKGDAPFEIWKVPFKGGTPVQITKDGGIGAVESSDGYLYYSKYETQGVWKMPLSGGPEVRIWDHPAGSEWFNWAVGAKGIYVVNFATAHAARVDYFEFATRKTIPITTLDKPVGWGLALAPDGKSLLYVEAEFAESTIMLVKNIR